VLTKVRPWADLKSALTDNANRHYSGGVYPRRCIMATHYVNATAAWGAEDAESPVIRVTMLSQQAAQQFPGWSARQGIHILNNSG
jgi:hypothetical protein